MGDRMNLRTSPRSEILKYVIIAIVLLASIWYCYCADQETEAPNTSTMAP